MKLRVVITDANILIDLVNLNLSAALFESDIFEFKTTDFVFEELYEKQKEKLHTLIEAKQLEVLESDEVDLQEIFKLKQQTAALSIQDCSVWHYASKLKGILLTGDGQLRSHSNRSGIEVRGILFLFDQMLLNKLITYTLAIEKLSHLSKINKRLPKMEMENRLRTWKGLLNK
ncbi:MAG TPA: hypothetical protein VK050_05500 [Flavobacteriaceae bacterium]|nr:hypothetical protein [Flavobacteriaceae bacterium]